MKGTIKMRKLLGSDSFLHEAKSAKFQPNVFLQILLFIAVFIVSNIVMLIPMVIFLIIQVTALMAGQPNSGDMNAVNDIIEKITSSSAINLISLFLTGIATLLTIVYCRFIEKRSLKSMGFIRKGAMKQYMTGLFVGFVMFSVSVGICVITGTLKYEGIVLGGNIGFVLLFFLGFLIQGMEEEVMLRGYFMVSLSNKVSVIAAIIINSAAFSVLHLANAGISALAVLNLTLFGIFASVYAIKTNNLWGVCAIHSIWNFVQGNLYGILVSGMELNASVFKFVPTESGTLINGGAFGLEGGLAVTFVLTAATVITLFYKRADHTIDRNATSGCGSATESGRPNF
jgi:membrane protease YdiL (CAAX protease family)